ncbi:hypothetical protein AB4Y90_02895 [Chryseobacterium sp. 2TAF14]|uniref:hypothetical protein n=1 Tax=Chryseobacterium sp. 2TAF14 TaxID=3233007 RepID=UPI003F8FEE16
MSVLPCETDHKQWYTIKKIEALLNFWEVNLQKRKRNICFPTRSFLPSYQVILEIRLNVLFL